MQLWKKNKMLFQELAIKPAVAEAVKRQGFTTMTPIQEQTLPLLMEGSDIVAQAPTGSGKTLSFAIALLEQIDEKSTDFQALVLAPTRELAKQIAVEIRKLTVTTPNFKVITLIGGESLKLQQVNFDKGTHVVVATPGRIIDFMGKGLIDFSHVKVLVLDEADKMLDMGFTDDIKKISAKLSPMRQSMLFSATFSDKVLKLSNEVLHEPQTVMLQNKKTAHIDEFVLDIGPKDLLEGVLAVLDHFHPTSTVIFCNTKQSCKEMERELQALGLDSLALHGDLDQSRREEVLFMFENGSVNILVATDVASRGLDIKALELVINAELPQDHDLYLHRRGRTGRAGEDGRVVSFFRHAGQLEKLFKTPNPFETLLLNADAKQYKKKAQMDTLFFLAGKKDKIRKGDIVGALCRDAGLDGNDLGMIKIEERRSFVAVKKGVTQKVLNFLKEGKIKNKKVKAKRI